MTDINNPDDKFSPYHNLTAYLTKGKKSEGFDDMIDFLCQSKIHFALTVNPTIYIPHMEDFWNTAVYSTEQGIPQIKAKVVGKDIIISEATLQKHLQLQDEGAAISYPKEEYMRTFVSIGYTGNQNEYTIEKALMGPPWKYPCNTLLQCISHKRSGWHQVSSTLAFAVHGINVPLLSTMVNIQSTQGDSSAIPADTDPTPSTSNPKQQAASIAQTHVQTTKDAQVQKSLTSFLDVIVQLEQRAPVATTYIRKRSKKTPSLLVSQAQSQPKSPNLESQHSDENIKKDSHTIRETSLEVSLLGSGSQPGSIEQPAEPYHYFSSLNLSAEAPSQDDIPSPTTTILEVLIDLAAGAPNPSSSPKKVHSSGTDRVNVERAVTTPGTSTAQEDSDNITKTLTTTTHSEDVSFEILFTERNPRRQENQGDGDVEARPKAPSSSKDSTTVDEDRLKLHNMELTARVAMLEAEVSKLRHQVSMHEAHQCPTVPTPSLVSVGTQTDSTLCTDATKKGEHIPEAASIISQTSTPQFSLTSNKLEFDSILAWGYDGIWEFSGVEELNWNTLNALQVLNLYLTRCINTSSDLSAELAINRFYDLMEDNMPWFERLLKEVNRVAYPESSSTAEQRLAPRRLDLIRSSALTEEEVICWQRFLYNIIVRDLEVLGWESTDSSDFTFFLSNGSSLSINIKEILLLPSDFLHKNVKEAFKAIYGNEWEKEESEAVLSFVSTPHHANEAEAKIPTASLTSAVVVHEAEAEASNKDKGKRPMTEEDEEKLLKEKKETKERRRREEKEMAKLGKAQERKAAILLREQQIQLYAKQLDDLKVKIPAVYQIQEDEALALQLQEQFDKEEKEREKKKEEAKFRITDS
ncbi:hypothetical protein L1987_08959 [Smallanthus sonchifolius]|uniref:Uncharacterized protein n=1 Tax=Smallanthus sonchifolius TaxID=185202 RepID=A0ACB9JM20_9ASTR|nr:hypothetical protein L1987_08959 [Smallanthus sonchifolius]